MNKIQGNVLLWNCKKWGVFEKKSYHAEKSAVTSLQNVLVSDSG